TRSRKSPPRVRTKNAYCAGGRKFPIRHHLTVGGEFLHAVLASSPTKIAANERACCIKPAAPDHAPGGLQMIARVHPSKLFGALLLVSLLFSPQLGLAQFAKQRPKLVGPGAVGAAQQGTAVALSADGNTAIVGGWSDNSQVGAVWVFTRS